jgi:hypothetical protein
LHSAMAAKMHPDFIQKTKTNTSCFMDLYCYGPSQLYYDA